VGVTPSFGSGALGELIELGECGGSSYLFEGGQSELFVGDAH
jgi:hypothetical protein